MGASSAASSTPAASACTRAKIKVAISHFFYTWNHRDAAALERLFTLDGVFEMATKHQNTFTGHTWASVGGPGARRMIAGFAERQWRLGEKLSYRGIGIDLNGGEAGDGGFANNVVASFADGTRQPMEEAKFIYDCASQAFVHVVITSAKAASA